MFSSVNNISWNGKPLASKFILLFVALEQKAFVHFDQAVKLVS